MAVKLEQLLVFSQIASVVAETIKAGLRGTLTEQEAADSLEEVQANVADARNRFHQALADADAREAGEGTDVA